MQPAMILIYNSSRHITINGRATSGKYSKMIVIIGPNLGADILVTLKEKNMGIRRPRKNTPRHNKQRVARTLSRSKKTKRQVVKRAKAGTTKAKSNSKQKSEASRAELTHSFTYSPQATSSTGKFGTQGQVTRTLIRSQKTNWPSAVSRTEGRVESKRNPTVRRNKGTGRRNKGTGRS